LLIAHSLFFRFWKILSFFHYSSFPEKVQGYFDFSLPVKNCPLQKRNLFNFKGFPGKSVDFPPGFLYNVFEISISAVKREVIASVRLRNQPLGNKNLIGARVEAARKSQGMKQKELLAQLQVRGVDLNASGLSKLEGQIRLVTDFELLALSDILNVSVFWLLTGKEK